MLKYICEEKLENFPAWSGGRDTLNDLTYSEIQTIDQMLEDVWCYDGNDSLPTDTQINDFLWFERDTIAEWLGYSDYDDLLEHRN